jgi:hypothetical protein
VTAVFLCGCVLFSGCATEVNKRLQKDSLSESEGLNRVLEVYSADGKLLKTYKGKFDIEISEGGKIKFDIGNKRTILYNATVICDEITD